MTTYNGWTNYATWRVNLELFDGMDIYDYFGKPDYIYILADQLKEFAINIITDHEPRESLTVDYAMAFLNDVNWREIATHMLDEAEA